MSSNEARHWHRLPSGQIQCDLCPRFCTLQEGQSGLCFVRARKDDRLWLTTYGRSSGFNVDPIEKKPLHHFYPGTTILSFGTAGCNLACRFCQNSDISKSREMDVLSRSASPRDIVEMAISAQSPSIAFTYNDPVIFLEYAVDVAREAKARGLHTVAVTAGYINPEPRVEFFEHMDAANIDLKSFQEEFYQKLTGAHLGAILDTLKYVKHHTGVWLEITTLLIPEMNDSAEEIRQLCEWIAKELGPEVPLHFSAFHPSFKMLNVPSTPYQTLTRARNIAKEVGLHYVYLGNVHDPEGQSTFCQRCGTCLITRDWYKVQVVALKGGACAKCQAPLPGRF
ncbi:MAG: AmmeMemoRadiSam system radical SAM enzyme [Bdellovibrionales bacterium GWA2_49_15]|nr:MAG: AmmeMemoRadiSam system radical SAM enzyme [Bdellovibrionales bacterium GWA2_49_15]HAZ11305.1 AmmeMemoRadiSam system radical SAM enzyme [Bdellovibrionales bacterium]